MARRSERHITQNGGSRAIYGIRIIAAAFIVLLIIAAVLKLASYIGGISRSHLKDEGYVHAAQFDDCIRVMGIDVSAYQGDINWKKVKSSEADFVFIRAGYRDSDTGELCEDGNFVKNMKGAGKAGMMTGAYFFSQALNESEAAEEADYLADLVKRYDIDMPLVIDFEIIEGGRVRDAIDSGDLYAASQFHDIVLAFCREVQIKGYEAAVYGNYDMFTNNMQADLLDDDAVIWVAQYDQSCDLDASYMYWQCSETAETGGIDGYVDQDFWYIEPGRAYETGAAGIADAVSIGECTVEIDEDGCRLKNHRAEPKITVTYDGKKLRSGKHYESSYVCNTVKGTGYVIVRGTGTYKDWVAVPFTID